MKNILLAQMDLVYLKKKNKFTTKAFNKKSFRSNDNKFLKPKELLQTINKEYQNYIF